MNTAMEDVARAATQLPRHQRLALARFLLDLDSSSKTDAAEVDAAWDTEINERVRCVEEGRSEALPYEEVLARIDQRIGS